VVVGELLAQGRRAVREGGGDEPGRGVIRVGDRAAQAVGLCGQAVGVIVGEGEDEPLDAGLRGEAALVVISVGDRAAVISRGEDLVIAVVGPGLGVDGRAAGILVGLGVDEAIVVIGVILLSAVLVDVSGHAVGVVIGPGAQVIERVGLADLVAVLVKGPPGRVAERVGEGNESAVGIVDIPGCGAFAVHTGGVLAVAVEGLGGNIAIAVDGPDHLIVRVEDRLVDLVGGVLGLSGAAQEIDGEVG